MLPLFTLLNLIVSVHDRYNALLKKARERRQKLVDSYKRHGLSREMSELEAWIEEKVRS